MDLTKEFDHQLAGITWSLWRELGVLGTDRFHENCLIQLEELIILTSIVAKYDPRLREETLDWLSHYHEYVSISRLRTLLKELNVETMETFLHFAAALNSVSSANWLNAKDSPYSKIQLSGKSLLPPLESPALLNLRLRSLFGAGTKADVITYFLTKNRIPISAPELLGIGYSKKTLIAALDQLSAAGLFSVKNIKNKKIYELNKPKELQIIIGKLPKFAPPWNKILQVIVAIRSAIPEIQNSSESTQNVLFRNCLINIEHLLSFFISQILYRNLDFKQDWKSLLEILNAFRQGNFSMQFEVYDDFDKIVIDLLQYLYQVDDNVDGIETIQSERELHSQRHEEIYKECYQLFLSFVSDLESRLKQFLELPIYKMLDEPLADIHYRFVKEKFPQLLIKIREIKPLDKITNVQLAVQQYQKFTPEFNILRQFIHTFRKRLEDLYFARTDINLLTLPTILHKRHLVYALFSE